MLRILRSIGNKSHREVYGEVCVRGDRLLLAPTVKGLSIVGTGEGTVRWSRYNICMLKAIGLMGCLNSLYKHFLENQI